MSVSRFYFRKLLLGSLLLVYVCVNAQVSDTIMLEVEAALRSYESGRAYSMILEQGNIARDDDTRLKYKLKELQVLEQMEFYDEAILLSNSLIAKSNLSVEQRVEVHLLRALVYEILDDLSKAKQSLDISKQLIQDQLSVIKPDSEMIGRYYIRSSSYFRILYAKTQLDSDYENYQRFAKEALDFNTKYGYKNMIADANMLLSFDSRLHKKKQHDYMVKALGWWKAINDIHGVSGMYSNLAMLNIDKPISYEV